MAIATPPHGGRLTGGGSGGNEQLTAFVGTLLIVLLGVLGVTLLRMHQLIWLHLFVGIVLVGPVAVKLATTGHRFARHYTHDPVHRRKGPPAPILRLLGPGLILTTLAVLGSGFALMLEGPTHRGARLPIHKVRHLRQMPRALRAAKRRPGGAGRTLVLAGGLLAGLVLAVLLTPEFTASTSGLGFHHRLG
jgi:hypothetical protein